MIEKIKEVKDFGIFSSIPSKPSYEKFNKFNLFYGLNGSGKSTLSHLFSLIESKSINTNFPNSKWCFQFSNDLKISSQEDENIDLNIRVFDKGFVERNINWNNIIKGILVVSEDKKNEIFERDVKVNFKNKTEDSIKNLKLELDGDINSKNKKGLIKDNNNFLTEAAKNIKQKFQLIEVEDTYLSNYNKTKLESTLSEKRIYTQTSILNVSEIEKLSQTIKPQDKELLEKTDITSIEKIVIAHDRINRIIESTVTSKVIDSLISTPKKGEWAKTGLEIHNENENCAFCGNILTSKRVEELNNHFSDSYRSLIDQIDKAINWIDEFEGPQTPSINEFYKEYHKEYIKVNSKNETELENLHETLSKWKSSLESKRLNPFETIKENPLAYDNTLILNNYHLINSIIDKHNSKCKNENSIIQKAKINLELEYIKQELKRFNYYQTKKEEEQKLSQLEELNNTLDKQEQEINKLNREISTESLGAELFNHDLWKFLGRKDISLIPQSEGGYIIERNNAPDTVGKLLSEGEKTAIAFVYFINKLKENSNKVEDFIVVIDDPISSFDSNNLFSSYAYLKLNCNSAKQLFVLTHNYNYFRLVRDWFDSKNKRQKDKHKKDPTKAISICNAYSLEVSLSDDKTRYTEIKNAGETLLNYSSEYHYQFKKLLDYSNEDKIDLDLAYLSANSARKTLETFLKFKHPKKTDNFRELLQVSIKETPYQEKEEYIFKFINKYSHAQDFDNDASDNQIDEGVNVVKDILGLIKELDETHFNEMKDICTKQELTN